MNKTINYVCIDIETIPDLAKLGLTENEYNELDDSMKSKFINPIDSRIVAIGIRYKSFNYIINDTDEAVIVQKFWDRLNIILDTLETSLEIVGFNINQFDLPFIVSKSFVYNISILPFKIKDIIDIKEKLNCYKYGNVRGKMKEYAKLIGIDVMSTDGSDVFRLYMNNDFDTISKYLELDLFITDELYRRCVNTNIIDIVRW